MNKSIPFALLGACALLLFAAPEAAAQRRARNRVEKRQNAQEAQREKRAVQDDRQDRATFAGLLREYEAAAKQADRAAIKRLDLSAVSLLEAEVKEAHKEIKGARMERNQSAREVNASTREVKRNRRAAKGPVARADDRRDLRDDKRDAADDQKDLGVAQGRAGRMEKSLATYKKFMGQADAKALDIKLKILRGMVSAQGAQVRQGQAERVESKQERREDKRERREPKRRR